MYSQNMIAPKAVHIEPCTSNIGKRQGGGIEPLHVYMPHELKSCPSTSLTHPGKHSLPAIVVLPNKCVLGVTQHVGTKVQIHLVVIDTKGCSEI